jgi:hypothetical protein
MSLVGITSHAWRHKPEREGIYATVITHHIMASQSLDTETLEVETTEGAMIP